VMGSCRTRPADAVPSRGGPERRGASTTGRHRTPRSALGPCRNGPVGAPPVTSGRQRSSRTAGRWPSGSGSWDGADGDSGCVPKVGCGPHPSPSPHPSKPARRAATRGRQRPLTSPKPHARRTAQKPRSGLCEHFPPQASNDIALADPTEQATRVKGSARERCTRKGVRSPAGGP
jgi:hypothetical protein